MQTRAKTKEEKMVARALCKSRILKPTQACDHYIWSATVSSCHHYIYNHVQIAYAHELEIRICCAAISSIEGLDTCVELACLFLNQVNLLQKNLILYRIFSPYPDLGLHCIQSCICCKYAELDRAHRRVRQSQVFGHNQLSWQPCNLSHHMLLSQAKGFDIHCGNAREWHCVVLFIDKRNQRSIIMPVLEKLKRIR